MLLPRHWVNSLRTSPHSHHNAIPRLTAWRQMVSLIGLPYYFKSYQLPLLSFPLFVCVLELVSTCRHKAHIFGSQEAVSR